MAKVKATTETPDIDQDIEFDPEELDDAAAQATAITTAAPSQVGALTGAVSQQDIPMPILSIVHGTSKWAVDDFHPGDLVLDKEHLLVSKTEPLNIIVVSANVYWKEYLDNAAYSAGIRPKVFMTDEEVLADGGTIAYGPAGEKPTFKKAMTLKMLIEKPENIDCYLFSTELFGKQYAPARWFIDKTAYARKGGKGVGLEIVKQAGFALKARGLLAGKWQVTTGFEQMGNNKVVVPSIKLVGQHTDEEIAEINAIVGG
jgi:hypothetical protein